MSGVFGWCGDQSVDQTRAILDRMGARMRHVPHAQIDSVAVAPGVGLGRVGIGIFNPTRQPVTSTNGAVWLCLTGEFYDEVSRRDPVDREGGVAAASSAEQLALATYLEDGTEGLCRLEGMFSIAVWDGRTQELLLVNDRFGLYPQYYVHTNGGVAFAPEIKGTLCAPGVRRTLDRTAISQYVRFQQLLGDHTWFEDIRLLHGASILRYRRQANQLTISRYWDWDAIRRSPPITFDEAAREFTRLFQRAIDIRTSTPHRYGVYLSGGLDSRMVLGFVDRRIRISTLTYGQANTRDVEYAGRVARRAGADHHWFPFRDGRWVIECAPLHLALVEGLHSWVHAHGMTTLAAARELFDVNLSGWLAWGTLHPIAWPTPEPQDFPLPPAAREAALISDLYERFCRRFAWPGLTEPEAAALLSGRNADLRWRAFDSFSRELARTAHYPDDRRVRHFLFEQQNRRSTLNLVVFTRAAVEVRCPFLDYDFLTFLWSLPRPLRTDPQMRRTILTRRMLRLVRIPYDRDDRLPHASPWVRRPHAGLKRAARLVNRYVGPFFRDRPLLYADYEHYLRTDLRAWAESWLFDPRTEARGIFEPDAVRALWDRHVSGQELWTLGKIAPLITLEMVLRHLHDED